MLASTEAEKGRESLYRELKVIATAPVFNEELKIGEVVKRVPRDVVDEVLIVDDGSTDNSPKIATDFGATVISLGRTIGVGAAIRSAFDYALTKGASGGKLIGAGGGGFLMFYADDKVQLRHAMREQGLREVRFRFDFRGQYSVWDGASWRHFRLWYGVRRQHRWHRF